MFANSQMMGMDLAFPDVCLTPAGPVVVPIPYPNIAMGPTAIPSQMIVLIEAMPAHNLGTVTPLTNGDNAGVAMGVASGTVMGPARHLTAAFTILVGG
ncbi:MAG: type VI secretion protein, partial [Deltaproteobacteria bacterium 21-66-5]